jgi:hypothetical protein
MGVTCSVLANNSACNQPEKVSAAPGDARGAEAVRSGAPSITEMVPAVLNPRELEMSRLAKSTDGSGQLENSR